MHPPNNNKQALNFIFDFIEKNSFYNGYKCPEDSYLERIGRTIQH